MTGQMGHVIAIVRTTSILRTRVFGHFCNTDHYVVADRVRTKYILLVHVLALIILGSFDYVAFGPSHDIDNYMPLV